MIRNRKSLILFLSLLAYGCGPTAKETASDASTSGSDFTVKETDKPIVHQIESLVTDSLEYVSQGTPYTTTNYVLYYNAAKKLVKAACKVESESGDTASGKLLYFNDDGNVVLANYFADVIPENYFLDLWVTISAGAVESIDFTSSDKNLNFHTLEDLKASVNGMIFSQEDLKEEMKSTVLKTDFIEDVFATFKSQEALLAGSEKTAYLDEGDKQTYEYADVQVAAKSPTEQDKDHLVHELFVNIGRKKNIALPRYENEASFGGKYNDLLFIYHSDGFYQEVLIYNFKTEQFVYTSACDDSKISNGNLILTRKIKDAFDGRWLPECAEEKEAGQGVDYKEVIVLDLNTLKERATGQIICGMSE